MPSDQDSSAHKTFPSEIMGIINITADSFYPGSRLPDPDLAVKKALDFVSSGADYIDIGAESSRPGAEPVPEEREIDLLSSFMDSVDASKVRISVDTSRSAVAELCLRKGASMINDIYALTRDNNLADCLADFDCKVVLMHMQGNPATMQDSPQYNNVVDEIKRFLAERAEYAVSHGISEERLIIDPGIGFGKTLSHNIQILREIEQFKKMGFPVLVGPSRKKFIGEITGKECGERLFGTLGSLAWLCEKKIDILRIHDVPEAADMLQVYYAIKG